MMRSWLELEVDREEGEDKGKMLEMAKENDNVKKYIEDKKIEKEIFVVSRTGGTVNLVVK